MPTSEQTGEGVILLHLFLLLGMGLYLENCIPIRQTHSHWGAQITSAAFSSLSHAPDTARLSHADYWGFSGVRTF